MDKKLLLIVSGIVIVCLIYIYYKRSESFDETIKPANPLMGGDSIVVPILNKVEIGEPTKDEIGLSRKDIQSELDRQCQDFYGKGSSAKENTMNEIGCYCPEITTDIKSERYCGLMPLDQQLHSMRMMAYSNDYDQIE